MDRVLSSLTNDRKLPVVLSDGVLSLIVNVRVLSDNLQLVIGISEYGDDKELRFPPKYGIFFCTHSIKSELPNIRTSASATPPVACVTWILSRKTRAVAKGEERRY